MVAFESNADDHQHSGGVDLLSDASKSEPFSGTGAGSSIRDSDISSSLEQIDSNPESEGGRFPGRGLGEGRFKEFEFDGAPPFGRGHEHEQDKARGTDSGDDPQFNSDDKNFKPGGERKEKGDNDSSQDNGGGNFDDQGDEGSNIPVNSGEDSPPEDNPPPENGTEGSAPQPDNRDGNNAGVSNTQTVDPTTLTNVRTLNGDNIKPLDDLPGFLGQDGDVLDPGGGVNVVAGAGGSDVILGNGDNAFNTIATGNDDDGTGDLIVLGENSTNRIFDFSSSDRIGLTENITPEQISIGQGGNRDNGGINQPLDGFRNVVIFDNESDLLLGSLTFNDVANITDDNFVFVKSEDLAALTS